MQIKMMGVINVTPDSFSDGDQYNRPAAFKEKLTNLLNWADWVDIGAESTAPFNSAISAQQELDRLNKNFIPYLSLLEGREVSLDTYKLEVFREVYQYAKKFDIQLVFNDVSGELDEEVIDFLKASQVKYVFSHNLAPSREQTSDHMNFISPGKGEEFIDHMVRYFKLGIQRLEGCRFIIDPCFGFSKTREQNHDLLRHFNTFLLQIPYEIPCLIGISRKSFMRFPADLDIKVDPGRIRVEHMHSNVLVHLLRHKLKRKFIIRTHEPHPVQSALDTLNLFY